MSVDLGTGPLEVELHEESLPEEARAELALQRSAMIMEAADDERALAVALAMTGRLRGWSSHLEQAADALRADAQDFDPSWVRRFVGIRASLERASRTLRDPAVLGHRALPLLEGLKRLDDHLSRHRLAVGWLMEGELLDLLGDERPPDSAWWAFHPRGSWAPKPTDTMTTGSGWGLGVWGMPAVTVTFSQKPSRDLAFLLSSSTQASLDDPGKGGEVVFRSQPLVLTITVKELRVRVRDRDEVVACVRATLSGSTGDLASDDAVRVLTPDDETPLQAIDAGPRRRHRWWATFVVPQRFIIEVPAMKVRVPVTLETREAPPG